MKFFLIPFIVLIISQGIKLCVYFFKEKEISFDKIIWEGFWAGKFPSTHAAVVSSSLYLLYMNIKDIAVISFAFFISLVLFYGLIEDKKRQELLEYYFSKSNDEALKTMVKEMRLNDFSGHTFIQLFAGIILGVLISAMLI